MNRKIADVFFCIFIALILIVPAVTINCKPDQISEIENRKLAEPVPLHEGLTAAMTALESSVDDRIGFRENMMKLYNRWNYDILSGNHSKVISGKEGWLFFTDELTDYTGVNVDLSKTQRQIKILTAIDQWCKDRGITFLLAVGPNKSSVYDNYMPDYISRAEYSNLDQFLQYAADTDINVICPKAELRADRDKKELYYRQDTHWNSYGACYMMDQIVERLHFTKVDPEIKEYRKSSGDLLTMLGTGANEYSSLYTSVAANPKAQIEYVPGTIQMILHSADTASFICYRDSYTTSIQNFYTYYFNGSVWWQYQIDFSLVESEQPEYLILSTVERYLDAAIECNASVLY